MRVTDSFDWQNKKKREIVETTAEEMYLSRCCNWQLLSRINKSMKHAANGEPGGWRGANELRSRPVRTINPTSIDLLRKTDQTTSLGRPSPLAHSSASTGPTDSLQLVWCLPSENGKTKGHRDQTFSLSLSLPFSSFFFSFFFFSLLFYLFIISFLSFFHQSKPSFFRKEKFHSRNSRRMGSCWGWGRRKGDKITSRIYRRICLAFDVDRLSSAGIQYVRRVVLFQPQPINY